jgi:transcription elongation factor GreA
MAGGNQEIIYLTKEKFIELQRELEELKTKGRAEVARKIAEARAHGDISENAEYDAARNEKELLEIKIRKLEEILSKARLIDTKNLPKDRVYILSRVKLLNLDKNKVVEFTLVSPQEVNSAERKISVNSPVGKSLLGKKVGDIVEVKIPAGTVRYKILEINR